MEPVFGCPAFKITPSDLGGVFVEFTLDISRLVRISDGVPASGGGYVEIKLFRGTTELAYFVSSTDPLLMRLPYGQVSTRYFVDRNPGPNPIYSLQSRGFYQSTANHVTIMAGTSSLKGIGLKFN